MQFDSEFKKCSVSIYAKQVYINNACCNLLLEVGVETHNQEEKASVSKCWSMLSVLTHL
jgi:hypothetical protein